jgi:foldase protein PrsA
MRKSIMIRITALACMAALLVGCNLVRVNPEKDRQLVIAVVNGEDILKGDYLDMYEQQRYYYGITEDVENDPDQKESIQKFKESILDSLVVWKIIEQKAAEAGYTVTEEDLIKAREDTIADWADYLKSLDEDQGNEVLTREEYEHKAVESLQQTADERYTTVEEIIRKQAVAEKSQAFQDETLKDQVATVAEVESYYQENLSSQQQDPSTISSAGVTLYQTPGVKVRYIRLDMNDEQKAEYDTLAADNQAAADTYLKEQLYDRASSLAAEARGETDWEAMKEAYAEDDLVFFILEPFDMRKGGGWDDDIIDQLMVLNAGDVAEPIINNSAYYIYAVDEKLSEKVFTLDEKRDEIQDYLDTQKKNEKWSELTQQWRDASEVKLYKGRL